jgi:hypothetical protein
VEIFLPLSTLKRVLTSLGNSCYHGNEDTWTPLIRRPGTWQVFLYDRAFTKREHGVWEENDREECSVSMVSVCMSPRVSCASPFSWGSPLLGSSSPLLPAMKFPRCQVHPWQMRMRTETLAKFPILPSEPSYSGRKVSDRSFCRS